MKKSKKIFPILKTKKRHSKADIKNDALKKISKRKNQAAG
jgi:hypothetical protein